MQARLPWQCTLTQRGRGPRVLGRRTTRQAAQNLADRPYQFGFVELLNLNTGERWERRRGSWHKATSPANAPSGKDALQRPRTAGDAAPASTPAGAALPSSDH